MTKFVINTSGVIGWPNLELMQQAPSGDQICNFGATWWPNVGLMQVSLSGGQIWSAIEINFEIWTILAERFTQDMEYGLNTLGPLCLWQCFVMWVTWIALVALTRIDQWWCSDWAVIWSEHFHSLAFWAENLSHDTFGVKSDDFFPRTPLATLHFTLPHSMSTGWL